MLPAVNRLRKRADFERVMKRGTSRSTPLFFIRWCLGVSAQPVRFGFIVSNKISKRATIRNRAKRLLREVVRKHLAQFPVGRDYIIIAKRGIVKASFLDIQRVFETLFSISQRRV